MRRSGVVSHPIELTLPLCIARRIDRPEQGLTDGRHARKSEDASFETADAMCSEVPSVDQRRHNADCDRPCTDRTRQEMTPSLRIDIAEAIVWLHVVVIAFSVFGLVAIPLGAWGGWRGVRVFWWRALHIGILGIVALQAVLGRACFLTIWEGDLLRLAGQMASNEPLIQQWVNRAIYWPLPLWVFAVLYVTVCVYALLLW